MNSNLKLSLFIDSFISELLNFMDGLLRKRKRRLLMRSSITLFITNFV